MTWVLREHAVATLSDETELTLVLDGMEQQRKGAECQEHLMQVKALDGRLVDPG